MAALMLVCGLWPMERGANQLVDSAEILFSIYVEIEIWIALVIQRGAKNTHRTVKFIRGNTANAS